MSAAMNDVAMAFIAHATLFPRTRPHSPSPATFLSGQPHATKCIGLITKVTKSAPECDHLVMNLDLSRNDHDVKKSALMALWSVVWPSKALEWQRLSLAAEESRAGKPPPIDPLHASEEVLVDMHGGITDGVPSRAGGSRSVSSTIGRHCQSVGYDPSPTSRKDIDLTRRIDARVRALRVPSETISESGERTARHGGQRGWSERSSDQGPGHHLRPSNLIQNRPARCGMRRVDASSEQWAL
jgi:hypothetical protein